MSDRPARQARMMLAAVVVVAASSACSYEGTADRSAAPASTAGAAATVAPLTSSSTTTPTEAVTEEPTDQLSDDPATQSGAGGTPAPIITATADAPQTITLADVFEKTGWVEGSYQVPGGRADAQQAMMAELGCYDPAGMELRFSRSTGTLHLVTAQSLDSPADDQVVEFGVDAGSRRLVTKNVSFEDVGTFDIPLSGVSSLTIGAKMVDAPNRPCDGIVRALITEMSIR